MAKYKDLVLLKDTTPEEASKALYRQRKKLKTRVHTGPIKTIRIDRHRGHDIEIKTTYDIRIDGRPVGGHIELGNDGRLHYHGLPTYGWVSAVDMCRQLIDSFPDDFPRKGKKPRKAKSKQAKKRVAKTAKKRARKGGRKKAAPKRTVRKKRSASGRKRARKGS